MDFARSLEADHVVDYTQEDFTKNGKHYDLILDVKGYHSIFDYKRALSSNGVYVMAGGSSAVVNQLFLLGPWISMFSSKKMGLLLHKPNANDLDFITTLYEEGKITPVIDKRYPLNKVSEALRYFGEGHAKGKVVITVEHNNKA
jgi:NADPH:quinone reductase-like Zn-dependent oxidoreductase